MSILIDLKKAHDTTWKYGDMKAVYGIYLRGGMLTPIYSNLIGEKI